MSEKDNNNPQGTKATAASKTQANLSPLADIYTLLGVTQMTTLEGVRTRFFKLTRAIHRQLENKPDRHTREHLLNQLRYICIAHDILTDPVTRTDYDLRTMGLRNEGGAALPKTPEEKGPLLDARAMLRIGELLTVAGLLEATELEIACDMHKAMPEMQFGMFLVKQGFIEDYQLQAVLYAQKLLRKGLITIVQFQAAMEELESSGVPVAETVVERGYVAKSDLEQLEAEEESLNQVAAPVYVMPSLDKKPAPKQEQKSSLLSKIIPAGHSVDISDDDQDNDAKARQKPSMLQKLLAGEAPSETADAHADTALDESGASEAAAVHTGAPDEAATGAGSDAGSRPAASGNPRSTHDRIPAFDSNQELLEFVDNQPTGGSPTDESEEEGYRYDLHTGEQIVDLSMRKTFDKIPAIKPVLSGEKIDLDADETTGDRAAVRATDEPLNAVLEAEPLAEIEPAGEAEAPGKTEPAGEAEPAEKVDGEEQQETEAAGEISISHAVPSWKDQLDWGTPESAEDEEEEKEVHESESDSVVDLTHSVHLEAVEEAKGNDTTRGESDDLAEPSATESEDRDFLSRAETGDLTAFAKAAHIDFGTADGETLTDSGSKEEAESIDITETAPAGRSSRIDTGEFSTFIPPSDEELEDEEDELFVPSDSDKEIGDIIGEDEEEDDVLEDEDESPGAEDGEDEEFDEDAIYVDTSEMFANIVFDDDDDDDSSSNGSQEGMKVSSAASAAGDEDEDDDGDEGDDDDNQSSHVRGLRDTGEIAATEES